MNTNQARSQEWIDKIEDLVQRAESLTDPEAREITVALLRAVLDFHAAGLERLLEIAARSGSAGDALIQQIAADDLTSSMLLLHDLHPDDLETRLNHAIKKLQDVFASLGAKISLIGTESGTVRLFFDSSRAWPGTQVRGSVENAIFQAAPEITTVVVEGLKEISPVDFVPVSDLLVGLQR